MNLTRNEVNGQVIICFQVYFCKIKLEEISFISSNHIQSLFLSGLVNALGEVRDFFQLPEAACPISFVRQTMYAIFKNDKFPSMVLLSQISQV